MAYITTAEAHNQLILALLANLPAGFTPSLVKLPNRSMPSGYQNGAWLRPTTVIFDSDINAADGNCERTTGNFIIDMIFPIGEDTAAYRIKADEIKAAFKAQEFGEVYTQGVTITDNPDDNFYILQIAVNFYFEGA